MEKDKFTTGVSSFIQGEGGGRKKEGGQSIFFSFRDWGQRPFS